MRFVERHIELVFRPGQWLTGDEKSDVLVMWHDGRVEVLVARTAIEHDAGRGMFKWARLPDRAVIWGQPGENEMASTPGGIR